MKKIITTAVLLGIAGAAASPFLIGSQIESVTQEQAVLTNQHLAGMVKTNPYLNSASFTLESYDKTYTASTARSLLKLETTLPGDNGEPLIIAIPITSEITHGPYLGESGLGLAKVISRPDIAAMDLPEFIKADTFTLEDLIGFSGQVNETITVAPVTITADKGPGAFELGGIKANVETSLDNRLSFKGDIAVADINVGGADGSGMFHLKPFNIALQGEGDSATASGDYQLESGAITGEHEQGMTLAIEQLSAKGTYRKAKNIDLSLGEQEMWLTNVEINAPAMFPEPVSVPAFKVKTLIDEGDQETLNMKVNYSATLSPGLMAVLQSPVNVKTVDIDFGITSLPAAAFQAYMDLVKGMSSPEQSEASMAAMQEKLPELIRMVVTSAMAGSLKVKAETDEGELDADVDVNFIANETFSDDDAMALMMSAGQDPAALLPFLAGKGNVHLDKSVTDKIGMTPMVQMMAGDFVRLEGEAFKSELLIKDGEILINGAALPVFAEPEQGGEPLSEEDLSEEDKAALEEFMESVEVAEEKEAAGDSSVEADAVEEEVISDSEEAAEASSESNVEADVTDEVVSESEEGADKAVE